MAPADRTKRVRGVETQQWWGPNCSQYLGWQEHFTVSVTTASEWQDYGWHFPVCFFIISWFSPTLFQEHNVIFVSRRKGKGGRRGAVKIDCVVEVKDCTALNSAALPPLCSRRDKYSNAPLTNHVPTLRVIKPNFFINLLLSPYTWQEEQ